MEQQESRLRLRRIRPWLCQDQRGFSSSQRGIYGNCVPEILEVGKAPGCEDNLVVGGYVPWSLRAVGEYGELRLDLQSLSLYAEIPHRVGAWVAGDRDRELFRRQEEEADV